MSMVMVDSINNVSKRTVTEVWVSVDVVLRILIKLESFRHLYSFIPFFFLL